MADLTPRIERLLAEYDDLTHPDRRALPDDHDEVKAVWLALGDLGFRNPEHARESLPAIREAERKRARE